MYLAGELLGKLLLGHNPAWRALCLAPCPLPITHHAHCHQTHLWLAAPLCRSATYSGLLLAAAQAQPKFIEGLERQLAAFVADKESKRWVRVGLGGWKGGGRAAWIQRGGGGGWVGRLVGG